MSMLPDLHECSSLKRSLRRIEGSMDNVVSKHFIDKPRGGSHVAADKVVGQHPTLHGSMENISRTKYFDIELVVREKDWRD
jgi:hypothetical protein